MSFVLRGFLGHLLSMDYEDYEMVLRMVIFAGLGMDWQAKMTIEKTIS